jgi:hypothetical protein
MARFVDWYNGEHRHSAIRYVTPDERHSGTSTASLPGATNSISVLVFESGTVDPLDSKLEAGRSGDPQSARNIRRRRALIRRQLS